MGKSPECQLSSQERAIADVAPWSNGFNAYDEAQFDLYLRLLDAAAANATDAEICSVLLGINAQIEPERARICLWSHLQRARWLLQGEGFRHLIGQSPRVETAATWSHH